MNTQDKTTTASARPENVREVLELDLPVYWASYLINGDDSGLDGKELYEADKVLAEHNLPMPVSVDNERIGQYNGVMADIATYTFLL